MGLVYTQLKLSNPSLENLLPIDMEAVVDSGTAFLCVPKHVTLQLKLKELYQREVTTADNTNQLCPYVGPVHVRFQNRECMRGALVLGALPMKDMDLGTDPLNRRLMVNPPAPISQRRL